jgi:hypothetical protein
MSKIVVDQIQASGGVALSLPQTDGVAGSLLTTDGNAQLVFQALELGVSEVTDVPTSSTYGTSGQQVVAQGELYMCFGEGVIGFQWKGITNSYLAGYVLGEEVFNSTGTFTVPLGVTELSCVVVGSGGSGHYSWANSGGGGGALGWANSIPVTAGDSINVTVGSSVSGTNHGQESKFGSFVQASGGNYNGHSNATFTITDSSLTDSGGGKGGKVSANGYGGGGGAGGYTGEGGRGNYSNDATSGSGGGGGGGGGYDSSTYAHGGGGGVGLWGQGASGASGDHNNGNSFYNDSDRRYSGKGGSGGMDGGNNSNTSHTRSHTWGDGTTSNYTIYHGQGGMYGGGGAGGGTSVSSNGNFSRGGQGGVRVMWGGGRSFPNNAGYIAPSA